MRRALLVLAPILSVGLLIALGLVGSSDPAPAAVVPVESAPARGEQRAADLDGLAGRPGAALPSSARSEVDSPTLASLGPLATWGGEVVDARSGAPVEGAALRLLAERLEVAVESDARGLFDLEWPVDLPALLEVTHPDYVDLRRPTVDLASDLRVALLTSGAIDGHVVAQIGADLESARARLWPSLGGQARGEPLAEVDLDARGDFRFDDLRPGAYAVGVATRGAPVAHEPSVVVRGGLETELVLTLGAGERFFGHVITRLDRAPVEGVLVSAQPDLQGIGGEIERDAGREAVSAPDGSFELTGLTAGTLELELRTPWGALVDEQRPISADGLVDEATLVVPGPARLGGRVLDLEGRPVPGALVALAVAREARRYRWARPGDLMAEEHEGLRRVLTDGQGRFDLGEVAARQELQLGAYPPADSRAEAFGTLTRRLELSEGEARQVDLMLIRTTALFGRAVDAEGAPVEGATIDVEIAAGRERSFLGETVTDAGGNYRFELVPATRVLVDAQLEGHRGGSTWVDLGGPGAGEAPDLVLQPAFVVRGHVVDDEGWSVPFSRVTVSEPQPEGSRGRRRRARSWSDGADEFGRFAVDGLIEGSFLVRASAVDHRQVEGSEPTVVLPGEPYVVLTLERRPQPLPGAVTGELVLVGSGAPVPGLEIRGARAGTVLLDGPRFRLTGVGPGPVRLMARAPGVEPVMFDEIQVPEGGSVDVGRYETKRTTSVRVVVVDPEGRQVSGARVRLVRRVKNPRRGLIVPGTIDLRSNRNGGYEASGVGAYPWTLDVRHRRWGAHQEEVQVVGGMGVLRVTLEPRGSSRARKDGQGG